MQCSRRGWRLEGSRVGRLAVYHLQCHQPLLARFAWPSCTALSWAALSCTNRKPGSCESLPGIGGVDGAGARSQWSHNLRMVRGGKDGQSELQPEADVAKVGCCCASSKAGGNLERTSPVILTGLHMRGDSGF